MNTITAAFYVKNEQEGLEDAILSVRDFVDVVLIWDTGSTDGTPDIARKYADVLYTLPVPLEAVHFGEMESIVTGLAHTDWVLRIDGDETLGNAYRLADLVESEDYGVWKLPRYRWADLNKTRQLEKEAFPDWQYRLFLADGRSRYLDAVHTRFETPHPIGETYDVFLNHFVDPLHLSNPERVKERAALYERLAEISGKSPEGSEEAMRLGGHKT